MGEDYESEMHAQKLKTLASNNKLLNIGYIIDYNAMPSIISLPHALDDTFSV